MKRFGKFLTLAFGFFTLLLGGCKVENKPQEIQSAQRVELAQLNEGDPRPFFHAELKFQSPGQVKLPASNEELKNRIKIREAGSLFVREGKEYTPFKVTNRATESKLDMMMLFDLSGSMVTNRFESGTRLDAAKDAARSLLDNFRPGDRIAIAPFESHDVRARIDSAVFAETREDVLDQINRLQARQDGNTALYTATILALERLKKLKGPDRQLMLLVLTDGKNDLRPGDDPEALSRKDDLRLTLDKLREANIQTFTIGVGEAVDADALRAMVYPPDSDAQYSNASDLQSVRNFLARAKQSMVEQIGIDFFTHRANYQQLKSANLDVRIDTLDGKTLRGVLPFACRTAAGCTPERSMNPEEIRLATERVDAPAPPSPHWKELLWLIGRFAIGLAVIAGLWYGVPKLVWPSSPPINLPVRSAAKPPPRSAPKGRLAAPAPPAPPADFTPRKSFEETRFYKDAGPKG
jgi:Mg-chelatase subunit ChlD